MENSDWKDKLALAFNINVENIDNQPDEPQEVKHDIDKRSPLKIMLDKKNRSGKTVTLIVDIKGDEEAVKELAKELKNKCGCGGSSRGDEILIQGDVRQKVKTILEQKGFKTKII